MNRVKLNVKTRPPIVDRHDKPFCGICKQHTSNYTCPKCNVPYCSLSCFKAEAHLECSEAFYRKEVEDEMKGSGRSAEERRKMTDLLQRFEEQSLQNDESLEGDGDDERWEGVDLDKASPDAIWSLLSPAERDAFAKAMNDPGSKLARELLASEALRRLRRRPWWESPPCQDDDDTSEFGRPPELMKVPHHLASAAAHAPILYNILALCVAYAYVTRRLSASPLCDATDGDRVVAQDVLLGLLPYLADRQSTLLLGSVDEAVTFLWANLDAVSERGRLPRHDPPTRAAVSLCLADAASLFRPKSIAMVDDDDDAHAAHAALLALSDMADLFRARKKHVAHKLAFYAAHVAGQRVERLGAVAEEARLASLTMME